MELNRRQFLLAGIAAPALAAQQATPPSPGVAPIMDRGFAAVTRLTDGVYATIANSSKGAQAASNGGIIAGRDAVLIIEGHMQPEAAAFEIEAARAISRAPIRAAIDTHFHLDHSGGNLAYAGQHIPIIAHELVGPLMKERYTDLKGVDHSGVFAPIERRLAAATQATDKQHLQSDLVLIRRWYDSIDAATLAYPTESLSQAALPKTIDLGGLTAVIEFHLGHSPTDLIIRVPERGIVFTGDLLFNHAYGVAIDADMLAWRKVLDRFAGYDRRTLFVPGHGAACGIENVRDQADLMDDLRAHAEKMMRAGASAEEAESRYVVPARFESYGVARWNWSVGAALASYYSGLKKPA
jgi:cyclase